MLISKFDLYNAEWLDVVFANRNKEYGAYNLRQHYAGNLVKAMLIAFFTIGSVAVILGIVIRVKPVTEKIIEINTAYTPPMPPKVEPKKEIPLPAKPQKPQAAIKYVAMRPTEQPVTTEPPKIDEMVNTPVASVESKVPGNGPATNIEENSGSGTGIVSGPVEDKTVYNATTIEVMPEPFGGVNGWTKFLQKNLRYPAQATDKGVGGKVWISFIIEKDGHLSDITVLRGPGFGMDEEALRVLKLAPAWKPGVQNGRNVRVKYTIPINFSIGE